MKYHHHTRVASFTGSGNIFKSPPHSLGVKESPSHSKGGIDINRTTSIGSATSTIIRQVMSWVIRLHEGQFQEAREQNIITSRRKEQRTSGQPARSMNNANRLDKGREELEDLCEDIQREARPAPPHRHPGPPGSL